MALIDGAKPIEKETVAEPKTEAEAKPIQGTLF
jgi:hypothetical protein